MPRWFWFFLYPKKSFQEDDKLLKKINAIEQKEEKPSIVKDIWKEMLKSKIVIFSLVFLLLFFVIGIISVFAGLFDFPITPYRYEQIDYNAVLQGPSWQHWFGTDLIGRDMFTRVIFSMGTSVTLSLLVVLFGGLMIGVTLGIIAGYFGGWIDGIIMRTGELLANVPSFFMILFLALFLRPRYDAIFYSLGGTGEWLIKEGFVDFSIIFIVASLFYWIGPARIIRSQALTIREMPYIDAAKVLGASSLRIMVVHIFPLLSGIITLWVFQELASVVLLEVGLSYFGLGIRPPHPSFGVLFSENIGNIRLLWSHPHLLAFPTAITSLFILSFAFLEMRLNSIINAKYKGGAK